MLAALLYATKEWISLLRQTSLASGDLPMNITNYTSYTWSGPWRSLSLGGRKDCPGGKPERVKGPKLEAKGKQPRRSETGKLEVYVVVNVLCA